MQEVGRRLERCITGCGIEILNMAEIVAQEFGVDGVLNEEYSRPQYSQIHRLIREERLDKVKVLVEEDPRVVECPDLMNKRSLHVACSVVNSGAMVEYLLVRGHQVELYQERHTPLQHQGQFLLPCFGVVMMIQVILMTL